MQLTMFMGKNKFIIEKPIRLIELFAGYGSQALALKYLGIKFESYRICEWAIKSIQAYKDMHCTNDRTNYSKNLTQQEIVDYLIGKGISANYNEPMTYRQIKKLGEEKQRLIYNNIQATHNLVNIQQVKGSDLGIEKTDEYDYIMTYSFPCQDLSSNGKCAGMEKGSGTRSGMLWEVERILNELKNENRELPQILLMENVPEVIGQKNIKHFAKWLEKLESFGYKCYWQVLNAKDYGIPQNRKRCFMISILGDYHYEFPQKIELKSRLKDLIEDEVDKKFYLSNKAISGKLNTNFQTSKLESVIPNRQGIMPTLCARDYKDPKCVIEIEDLTTKNKRLASMVDKIDPTKVQAIDIYNQSVHDEMHTIKTNVDNGMTAITQNLRIRKLTPKECFRLMGVKDEDFENVAQNQSNASLYHLAGDSIVVDVLMAIFSKILKE